MHLTELALLYAALPFAAAAAHIRTDTRRSNSVDEPPPTWNTTGNGTTDGTANSRLTESDTTGNGSSSAMQWPTPRLRGIAYGGTGCPQGSLGPEFGSDGSDGLLAFNTPFQAKTGPNTSYADNRASCRVNYDLLYPEGWQYSLLTLGQHGTADLDSGVTATIKNTYYFSGSSDQVSPILLLLLLFVLVSAKASGLVTIIRPEFSC